MCSTFYTYYIKYLNYGKKSSENLIIKLNSYENNINTMSNKESINLIEISKEGISKYDYMKKLKESFYRGIKEEKFLQSIVD
ncbi:hypothetical protein [Clostridium rectalis]|uniref:hypothetical protein n=1 Tax=Clostridium rectalis TaxID=2040295 RepID=UPI000F62E58F|nr:hypothetical protein [Clostridium rectalis]